MMAVERRSSASLPVAGAGAAAPLPLPAGWFACTARATGWTHRLGRDRLLPLVHAGQVRLRAIFEQGGAVAAVTRSLEMFAGGGPVLLAECLAAQGVVLLGGERAGGHCRAVAGGGGVARGDGVLRGLRASGRHGGLFGGALAEVGVGVAVVGDRLEVLRRLEHPPRRQRLLAQVELGAGGADLVGATLGLHPGVVHLPALIVGQRHRPDLAERLLGQLELAVGELGEPVAHELLVGGFALAGSHAAAGDCRRVDGGRRCGWSRCCDRGVG